MSTENDLQSAQLRRAAAVKRLETSLARQLSRSELSAYQIGWNDGFADAIQQHKMMLTQVLAPTAEPAKETLASDLTSDAPDVPWDGKRAISKSKPDDQQPLDLIP